jgi:hypothetical protein
VIELLAAIATMSRTLAGFDWALRVDKVRK